MKKILEHIFIPLMLTISIIAYGCIDLKSPQNKEELSSQINPLVKDVIFKYIEEYDGSFIDKEQLYYNVFFETVDSINYFTIWSFNIFPDYIENCITVSKYNYYLFNIFKRKVVFIDKETNESFIFEKDSSNIINAKEEMQKPFNGEIYDGGFNEITYKILRSNEKIDIIKADTVISYFLHCETYNVIDEQIINPN